MTLPWRISSACSPEGFGRSLVSGTHCRLHWSQTWDQYHQPQYLNTSEKSETQRQGGTGRKSSPQRPHPETLLRHVNWRLPGRGLWVFMSRMGVMKACRPWQFPRVYSWARTMAWFEVFPTRQRVREKATLSKLTLTKCQAPNSLSSDDVEELTSAGPPFDGADCGRVQDKLLCCRVICGSGLQASKVCA